MRNWGIIISVVYALVVLLLFSEGIAFLSYGELGAFQDREIIELVVLVILLPILCQIALLIITVDRGHRWLRKRQHIGISIASISAALSFLTAGLVFSVWAAISGDDATDFLEGIVGESIFGFAVVILLPAAATWGIWALIFRRYREDSSTQLQQLFRWLYSGSVLQLLVVVPCHVWVRSREDCSAPVLTGFGIATGLSIMLLAFGPSVIYLYSRQFKQYEEEDSKAT